MSRDLTLPAEKFVQKTSDGMCILIIYMNSRTRTGIAPQKMLKVLQYPVRAAAIDREAYDLKANPGERQSLSGLDTSHRCSQQSRSSAIGSSHSDLDSFIGSSGNTFFLSSSLASCWA